MQSENTQTSVVVTNASAFVQNDAVAGDGGAFHVSGHDVSLFIEEDVHFGQNTAARRGGAVFISQATLLRIRRAFFVDNESKDFGGGAVFGEVSIERSHWVNTYNSLRMGETMG